MDFLHALLTATPWDVLLIAVGYGILVRFWLRPILAARYKYFSDKLSAPYYILFIGGLMLAATLLLFNLEAAAQKIASICYFVLATGTAVDLLRFKRSHAP